MQNHQSKSSQSHETGKPPQRIRGPPLARIHRLAIGEQFSKVQTRSQSSKVGIVIDSHPRNPRTKEDGHEEINLDRKSRM